MGIDIKRFLAEEYLAGLAEKSLADVRTMRDDAQSVENALSLVRRVIHGRLDIVGSEVARRAENGEVLDLGDLIHSLPSLLSDGGQVGGGIPRPPQSISVSDVADELMADLDSVADPSRLGNLNGVTEVDLADLVKVLGAYEVNVSQERRHMHDVIDELQSDIIRRYTTGEASVDTLLDQ